MSDTRTSRASTGRWFSLLVMLAAGVVVGSSFGPPATAQATNAPRTGIPNAGDQRLEMIRELRKLNESMTGLTSRLEKVEMKVEIVKMPKVEIADGEKDSR